MWFWWHVLFIVFTLLCYRRQTDYILLIITLPSRLSVTRIWMKPKVWSVGFTHYILVALTILYCTILTGGYKNVTAVSGVVSGFIFDANFKYRRLYWSVPGSTTVIDGYIFYMVVDVDFTVYTLPAHRYETIAPSGLAIHHIDSKFHHHHSVGCLYNVFILCNTMM